MPEVALVAHRAGGGSTGCRMCCCHQMSVCPSVHLSIRGWPCSTWELGIGCSAKGSAPAPRGAHTALPQTSPGRWFPCSWLSLLFPLSMEEWVPPCRGLFWYLWAQSAPKNHTQNSPVCVLSQARGCTWWSLWVPSTSGHSVTDFQHSQGVMAWLIPPVLSQHPAPAAAITHLFPR